MGFCANPRVLDAALVKLEAPLSPKADAEAAQKVAIARNEVTFMMISNQTKSKVQCTRDKDELIPGEKAVSV